MIKKYLELARVSNLPTIWTNVLAATVLSAGEFSWPAFLILAASMSLFYSGGMCLNDIFDADHDRLKGSSRPVASGRISIQKALLFCIVLFTTAFLLLLTMPDNSSFYAGFVLLAFIIVYDKFHKAHPLSVLLMASCRFMVFIVCGLAVLGSINTSVALAASVQFLYTVYISIMARFENSKKVPFSFPLIPFLIAGISLLDGMIMTAFASPIWLAAGIAGMFLTILGQRYIRGD